MEHNGRALADALFLLDLLARHLSVRAKRNRKHCPFLTHVPQQKMGGGKRLVCALHEQYTHIRKQ